MYPLSDRKTKFKFLRRLCSSRETINTLFFDYQNGIHKQFVQNVFEKTIILYTFVVAGVLIAFFEKVKNIPQLNKIYIYSSLVFYILFVYGVNHITQKLVFSKNKYVKYFDVFKRKNILWHNKIVIVVVLFELGVLITFVITFWIMSIIMKG